MAIDMNEYFAQQAEATGYEGGRIPFEWGTETFTFRDPLTLDDDEKLERDELEHEIDVAVWFMGEDEYDKLISTTATLTPKNGKPFEMKGSSSVFLRAMRQHVDNATAQDASGRPTRSNRSSRRAAARKPQKRG